MHSAVSWYGMLVCMLPTDSWFIASPLEEPTMGAFTECIFVVMDASTKGPPKGDFRTSYLYIANKTAPKMQGFIAQIICGPLTFGAPSC